MAESLAKPNHHPSGWRSHYLSTPGPPCHITPFEKFCFGALSLKLTLFLNFYWSIVDLHCVSAVQQSESVTHIHISTFLKFYFIFKLYIIVLVLPNIKMNPPQVYMCSPSWTHLLLPPHTIPLGRPSALAPSIQYRASNLDWQIVSYMIFYMFQCHSPKSSHPLPLPQIP